MSDAHQQLSRQKQVGLTSRHETRRRLVAAASAEFTERGYAGATVARIADRAGVTVQTLYLACGSKRELLRASMVDALTGGSSSGDDLGRTPRDLLVEELDATPAESPVDLLVKVIGFFRRLAERSAVGWQLYRDAASVDPMVEADWQHLQLLRQQTCLEVVRGLPPQSLRRGVTHEDAGNTLWVVMSPETYELCVTRAGWTLDRYEQWALDTVTAAVLALDEDESG